MKRALLVVCLTAICASGCKSSCEAIQQDLIPRLKQASSLAAVTADRTQNRRLRKEAWRGVLDRLFYAHHFSKSAYGYALGTAAKVEPYFDFTTQSPYDTWRRGDQPLDPSKGGCIVHRFDRGRRLSHRCFWILPCQDTYEYAASCTNFVYPEKVAAFNEAVKLAGAIAIEVPGDRTPPGPYSNIIVDYVIDGGYWDAVERTQRALEGAINVAQEAEAAACRAH